MRRAADRLMSVVVKIPTQLRAAAGGEAEAEVDGATVQEVLDGLFERHAELRERISDEDGSLRRFVNVYVAGEDIRFLDGLATPVTDGVGADDPARRRRRLSAPTGAGAFAPARCVGRAPLSAALQCCGGRRGGGACAGAASSR